MSGAAGQAAGLAVGAAVGSLVAPGAGTLAGAAIGGSLGGVYDSTTNASAQKTIDTEAIKLNQQIAHNKADATAAVHAENFRQALASQVALSSFRGGSGSLAAQFGNQAYRSFIEDQEAIQAGIDVADVQSELSLADTKARNEATNLAAVGRLVSAFDGLNLNAPRTKK